MKKFVEKISQYKILTERPEQLGGSLIEKIEASTHDVFSLMEKVYGKHEDLFRDFNWIDSKSNWHWFLKLANGTVRIYDYKNSVSIGSVSDEIISIVSEELKKEVHILKTLIEQAVDELPKEDRLQIDATIDSNPFQNFCATYQPVLHLIDRAKENGSLLEGIVLTISFIDALLRNCLILQNQIDNSNEEVQEEYIYQREKSYLSERDILKETKKRNVISVDLFDQITDFYNDRNKAVHRYFISNFQYRDSEDILNKNLNIIPELMNVLYEIEEKQIELGVGITKKANPDDENVKGDPVLRIDSNLKRIEEIVQPEIISMFEDPRFIEIMDTYHMRLNSEPFNKIKNGNKNIELRLYDEKRSKYKVGDPLVFVNKDNEFEIFTTKIKEIILKDKFSEIFSNGISKNIGGFNTDDDIDLLMQKHYTPQEVLKYGVIGIVLDTYGEKIDELQNAIKKSWKKDTCYEKQQEEWTPDVPSTGQCYVTSLVVNDHLEGTIVRAKTSSGLSHYWNRVDGRDIDFTRDQFAENESFTEIQEFNRIDLKENERYLKLKEGVLGILK